MNIKHPNRVTSCSFWMTDPRTGNPFRIPAHDPAHSLSSLTQEVVKTMAAFDKEGHEYTNLARERAKEHGIMFSAYIRKVIEHQICLRGDAECWDSGFGDVLHSFAKKVDNAINSSHPTVKRAARVVTRSLTKAATGHASDDFGTCSTCAGTITFSHKADNLGRAGKLNKRI